MKNRILSVIILISITCAALAQTGGPFDVNAGIESKAAVIATATANIVDTAEDKAARKGLLAKILDLLGSFASALFGISKAEGGTLEALDRSLMNMQQQEKAAGSAAKGAFASATASVEKRLESIKAKIPALIKHEPAGGKSITVGSEKFKSWFDDAAKHCSEWEFPDVTNKYGQKISREDYLRAIIWIESRGIHQDKRGRVTKSWAGAVGFMQLMPNTARGLKVNASDAAQNLKGGAKYLGEIFNSGGVSKKSGAEKLIMGACAYNLGPFSKSMKKSWEEFKTSKVPVETRSYGLKMKMALGLDLSADEKKLAAQWFVPSHQTVDEFTDEFYANAQGIAR